MAKKRKRVSMKNVAKACWNDDILRFDRLTEDDIHVIHWCPWQNKDCETCKTNKQTEMLASKVANELKYIVWLSENEEESLAEAKLHALIEILLRKGEKK